MYTVYKIININNNKYYIGVHKTDNPHDSYMGSGVAIKNAIRKYGKDSFVKEILLITEDKNEAYELEKQLTTDYVESTTYNMKLGGVGGFTKENAYKGLVAKSKKGGKSCKEKGVGIHSFSKEVLSENGRKGGLKNKGKPKSEEFKKNLRDIWARKKQNLLGSPTT